MTDSAVLLIPSDWRKGDAVGISKHIYSTYRQHLEGGLNLALMTAPPEAQIVAQAELADGSHLASVKAWSDIINKDNPKDGFGNDADFVLPLRLLYTYDDSLAVDAETAADIIDLEQLQEDGFLPISHAQYNDLFKRYRENIESN